MSDSEPMIPSCLQAGRLTLLEDQCEKATLPRAYGTFLTFLFPWLLLPRFLNPLKIQTLVLFFVAFFWTLQLSAALPVTTSYQFSGLNLPIPDPDGRTFSGVQDTRQIAMDYDSIESISVTLDIVGSGSGAYNGDFYAYLTKGDHIAILLNRPGRTAENPSGYGDNGLNVRFQDNALNGDIHLYRFTLSGSHHTPLAFGTQLTGTWAPDGRHLHPQLTLDTHPRTHTLDGFKGNDPNGEWTLFVVDMEPGGTGVLASWGLEIVAVPEPGAMSLLVLGLMLLAAWRRNRRG